MSTGLQKIAIKNDIAEIPRVAAFIDAFCEEQGAGLEVAFKINLAVEEALVNTISYGFKENEGHEIIIEIGVIDASIVLTLIDDAIAFNPLEQEMPDVNAPAHERRVGGLGVFLIRETMDDIQYKRDGDRNRLTLRKSLAPETSG